MITVHKFSLSPIDNYIDIAIAGDAPRVVLIAKDKHDHWCMWVELDTADAIKTHRVVLHGTGHAVQLGCNHIGSMVDNPYVWHFYSPTLRKAQ